MKFAFVILHYLTDQDTEKCVNSIKINCNEEEVHIIIVDNHSNNGSCERLNKLFKDDDQIDIISSSQNIGFAKGNNLGISFANDKYSPDFVVVLNNDIVVMNDNTCKIICEAYQKYKFAAMGPMVLTRDGRCDANPFSGTLNSEKDVRSFYNLKKRAVWLGQHHLWGIYHNFFGGMKRRFITRKKEYKNFYDIQLNVKLHGCFIVFSKKYFEKFIGFYPDTFLYLEEEILYHNMRKSDLLTLYYPKLCIYHKEDSASDMAWGNRNKVLIQAQLEMDSAKKYLELLKKENN